MDVFTEKKRLTTVGEDDEEKNPPETFEDLHQVPTALSLVAHLRHFLFLRHLACVCLSCDNYLITPLHLILNNLHVKN